MTPLRREIRIPIYWLVVGLLVMVASPLASIYASAQINQRTIRAAEAARQEAAQQVETAKQEALRESLVRYCRLIGSQVDVYSEATTPVGRDAYSTWLAEYRIQGCQPRK